MNLQEDHINYTAADIEKYWKGELSAAQQHAMEKAALEDPFLADAMEGYEEKIKPSETISTDIDLLKQQLADSLADKQQTKVIGFGWWKIAAVFLVVAGAAVVYTLMNKKENDSAIAKNKAVEHSKAPAANSIENELAKDKAVPSVSQPVSSAAEVADEKTKEAGLDADSALYKHEDVAKLTEIKKNLEM